MWGGGGSAGPGRGSSFWGKPSSLEELDLRDYLDALLQSAPPQSTELSKRLKRQPVLGSRSSKELAWVVLE